MVLQVGDSYLLAGDIIEFKSAKWRVLEIVKGVNTLIELNTKRLNFCCFNSLDILDAFKKDEIQICEKASNSIFDFNKLSEACKKIIDKSMTVINELLEIAGTISWFASREKGIYIQALSEKYKLSRPTIYRYLRLFFQGGMCREALVAHYSNCGAKGTARTFLDKKPGPKGYGSQVAITPEIRKQFETMYKRFQIAKGKKTYKALYEDLVSMHYSNTIISNNQTQKIVPYALTQIPSKRQFYYWISKQMDKVDKYIIKNGKNYARNNIRPLLSDTLNRNHGAGHVIEMDEAETDFYLVSRFDRSKVLGRAILYSLIDVYSKSIVGISVGFNNNSWAGASLALYNMAEDKVEYCKRYGIDITEEEWPMHHMLPQMIRVDNGAEYTSQKYMSMVEELGVTISHVPPASGSFKSNIEQSFRQFNSMVDSRIPGQIYKEYNSTHKKKAALDIEQFTKIVIEFVLYHNGRYLKNYPVDKKMKEIKLDLTPINLWNYSIKKDGCVRKIESLNQFKYALLTEDTATITREGINFKGLLYLVDDMEWLKKEMSMAAIDGAKKRNLTVRYDRRTTNYIYFLRNQEITIACMNKNKTVNNLYRNLTWDEVEELKRLKKEIDDSKRYSELERNVNFNLNIEKIVEQAEEERSKYLKNDTSDIRKNRKDEKLDYDKKVRIVIEPETELCKQDTMIPTILETQPVTEKNFSTSETIEFFKKKRVQEYYSE